LEQNAAKFYPGIMTSESEFCPSFSKCLDLKKNRENTKNKQVLAKIFFLLKAL